MLKRDKLGSHLLASGTAYSWSAKSIRLLALHPTLTWGTTKGGQGYHHLPPTPTDHGQCMQTMVITSLDTASTLSITTLAQTPSKTRALRLEHPSQGWTMIPQPKNNKSLTLIRTQQVDDNLDTYSKEACIRRGTSRGKPTSPALLPTSPHTLPSLLYKIALRWTLPLLLLLSKMWCV